MKKLVGYLTPKIPDNAFTVELAQALFEAGMDTLELGVPFSDPVADGPVIELAGQRALANGFTFADLYEITGQLKGRDLLWMGYMNPFYHHGMETVAKKAQELGVSGLIIPDLPHEEAAVYAPLFESYGAALIEFVAPTTPADRVKAVLARAKKFVYLVAYTGITGAGGSEDLQPTIASIKAATKTPVYVGFGVNRETAALRAQGADGVIVGSAFVKILMDDSLTGDQKLKKICDEARAIKAAINA